MSIHNASHYINILILLKVLVIVTYLVVTFGLASNHTLASEVWKNGWQRLKENPVLTLSDSGVFDSENILTPAVVKHAGRYYLYYSGGPSGPRTKEDYVNYQLGLATSEDGVKFTKLSKSLLPLGKRDNFHVTPTLLRNENGNLLLDDDGTWHMFYSSNRADDVDHATSRDGIKWEKDPKNPIFSNAYAPNLLKIGNEYRLYYVHKPKGKPWKINLATGADIYSLKPIAKNPVLTISQKWETQALIYPYVLKQNETWIMFYTAYWKTNERTAIGSATSNDGITWTKNSDNPIFQPEKESKYDSLYTSSPAVIRDGDLYRLFYGGRINKVHKYFSIAQATKLAEQKHNNASKPTINYARPQSEQITWPGNAKDKTTFIKWQVETRDKLKTMLGIPEKKVPLAAEKRGESEHDGIVVERWVFTSEPGSRVPATLFRPKTPQEKMPAIVLTYGHGGSKGAWSYNYAAQMYAKLGLAVLAIDPVGEEERSSTGEKLGTREHDHAETDKRAHDAGRLIMGKLVFDSMRGIDFLLERDDIDRERIGVMGHSLGGAVSGWMAALDTRVKMSLVCGWAYDDILLKNSKLCTRVPNIQMRAVYSWSEYASLCAPHCAVLVMNGDADTIIDNKGDGSAWTGTKAVVVEAGRVYKYFDTQAEMQCWFEPKGGHRPYFTYKKAAEWINRYLGMPGWSAEKIADLPEINAGRWCDAYKIKLEKLYGTELHDRGATIVDLQLKPIPREDLKCLKPNELGSPEFTIKGWLDAIEAKKER